ncbi:hypothetical protein DVH24_026153 [Malus domestica]|uniref:Pectinesterase n=1 Tax=Malus domestica TaxID=3750 RepID=A0A498KHV5_MALDO|nr:hypothetical protein DVH24_026153 [Malus domestica]
MDASYNNAMKYNLNDEISSTITVDKGGQGNYTTVKQVVDSIPSNNSLWIRILLNHGIYVHTFKLQADNFVAQNIMFKLQLPEKKQVFIIVLSLVCKAQCMMVGVVRHYLDDCFIECAMDFTWGNGQPYNLRKSLETLFKSIVCLHVHGKYCSSGGLDLERICRIVSHGRKLSQEEVAYLTNLASLIDQDGWLEKQPK